LALAVHNPVEIWHLSRLATCRHLLDNVHDADTRAALIAAAETSWQAYVAASTRTPGQQEAMIQAGQPAHIALDEKEGFPVVTWNENNPALSDAWGFLQIRPTNSPATPNLALSTPFRQVEIANLPTGSRCFALHDPRHTATAAVEEIVGLVLRDLGRARDQYQGDDVWRALRSHASFLVAAARASLERLPHDDFRDWQRPTLSNCPIELAAERVAALALTTRAQQSLALHFVARGYAALQEEVGDEEARVDALVRRLETASTILQTTLGGLNQAVLAKSNVPYTSVVPTVIFRPIPYGVPVLAAVPLGAMTPTALPRNGGDPGRNR
jgi:hypothetical protein